MGVALAQDLAHTRNGSAGAYGRHEGVANQPAQLGQNFGPGRTNVRFDVRRIVELLRHEKIRVLRAQFVGLVDRAGHHLDGRGQVDLGAVGFQQRAPLQRHVVRHGQDQTIAFGGAHQSQADARVAGGRLDDHRFAGVQAAGPLGGFDHGERHAILDRAPRVELFTLAEHGGHVRRYQVPEADQRRAADQFEHVVDGDGGHRMRILPHAGAGWFVSRPRVRTGSISRRFRSRRRRRRPRKGVGWDRKNSHRIRRLGGRSRRPRMQVHRWHPRRRPEPRTRLRRDRLRRRRPRRVHKCHNVHRYR